MRAILVALALALAVASLTADEVVDQCPDDADSNAYDYGPSETLFWDLVARGEHAHDILEAIKHSCWITVVGADTYRQYNLCHDVTPPTEFQWAEIYECVLERAEVHNLEFL